MAAKGRARRARNKGTINARTTDFASTDRDFWGDRREINIYIYVYTYIYSYVYISPNSFSARVGPLSKAWVPVRFYEVSRAKWLFPISDPGKHVTLGS